MAPLCREIENDLRLHIHTVVLGQRGQSLPGRVRDPARFFRLRPIRFFGTLIDIKGVFLAALPLGDMFFAQPLVCPCPCSSQTASALT